MSRRRTDRHGRVLELLSARLLGELPADESAEVASHLAACERCSMVAAEYARESRTLRSLPRFDAPRDLWARTSVALDRELRRGRRPWARPVDPYEPPRRGVPAAPGIVAVAVLGLIGALVAGQVLPFALGGITGRLPSATPFAIPPQELALVGADPEGLAIMLASVEQVCPQPMPDCVHARSDRRILRASILRSPSAVAIGPDGDRMAITGRDLEGGVVYAVLELAPFRPGPATRPEDVPSTTPGDPSNTRTGAADTTDPAPPPVSPSSQQASPSLPRPDGGPVTTPTNTGTGPASPTGPAVIPPQRPAQDDALAILRGVLAAGAPPAWSPDGRFLAFSAMPADGSTGPDIYLWRPGYAEARRLTHDHRSWFASWAGHRIVVSRVSGRPFLRGKELRVAPQVAVIDPRSGEERILKRFRVWLPTVDPSGERVVAWRGALEPDGPGGVRPTRGVLVLADWERIDPFGKAGDARQALAAAHVVGRGSSAKPLRDWQVRWSADGRAHGVWIADAEGDDAGMLTVAATDPEPAAAEDEPLLGPVSARRGFSIGLERVAWVAPGSTGEARDVLQVGTWGPTGAGTLRITELETSPAVPGFY